MYPANIASRMLPCNNKQAVGSCTPCSQPNLPSLFFQTTTSFHVLKLLFSRCGKESQVDSLLLKSIGLHASNDQAGHPCAGQSTLLFVRGIW